MKRFAGWILAAGLLLGLTACGSPEPESLQVIAMDTAMTFTVYDGDSQKAVEGAAQEVRRLESLLSRTDPKSMVSRLNAADGASVDVGTELCGLLNAAQVYSQATDDSFDITLADISSAWGFTTDSFHIPQQAQLDALLKNVGMEHIHALEDAASLDAQTRIDLGAIAKGYASDKVAELYRENGVSRGWASLGGNVVALGERLDGTAWRVGIQDPRHADDSNAFVGMLQLKDAYAVTSGSYQRYFEENGKRYHHIIDPATGAPAESGLVSVTVVADDTPGNGTMCDALSTALFVMGEQRALEFWRSGAYDFQLILVTDDDRVVITDGLKDTFALEGDGYVGETVS